MQTLAAAEIDDALTALPGWHRYGEFLARQVPVERGAQPGLLTDVRRVVPDQGRFNVMETADAIVIYLGDALTGGVTDADVETAARIDTVLDGSGTV